jgi:hypothetical protein
MNGRRESARRWCVWVCSILGATLLVVCGPFARDAGAAARAAWAKVVSFDVQTSVLSVTSDGAHQTDLVHTGQTVNAAAVDPHGFPPGPCKRLALMWNHELTSSGDPDVRPLLTGFADNGCAIGYVTSSTPNADGSYNLLSIAPAKL